MKYTQLLENKDIRLFSIQDLKLFGYEVNNTQLFYWVKEGKIIRLKNGLFVVAHEKENVPRECMAEKMYNPSYISLEYALAHYGLIPEMIYNTTSVTSKPTRTFINSLGTFMYRSIKKDLFWGYTTIEKNGFSFRIAEKEKTLIDYVYLNSHKIKTESDIEELRLNGEILETIDKNKMRRYLEKINNKNVTHILTKICSL